MRISREKLAAAMVRKDLTQIELAKKSGVSRSTICGVQCGRSCNPRTAYAIANALEMELEDLTENNK